MPALFPIWSSGSPIKHRRPRFFLASCVFFPPSLFPLFCLSSALLFSPLLSPLLIFPIHRSSYHIDTTAFRSHIRLHFDRATCNRPTAAPPSSPSSLLLRINSEQSPTRRYNEDSRQAARSQRTLHRRQLLLWPYQTPRRPRPFSLPPTPQYRQSIELRIEHQHQASTSTSYLSRSTASRRTLASSSCCQLFRCIASPRLSQLPVTFLMGAAKSTLLIINARPHHEKSKMAQQLPQGGLTGTGTCHTDAYWALPRELQPTGAWCGSHCLISTVRPLPSPCCGE